MEGSSNGLSSLQSYLDGLLDRVPSCNAVLVTDPDGVVLLKSVAAGAYQENSVDAMLAAVFANSAAQASKLQFGRSKAAVAWRKDRVVVHIDASPYFVSVICNKDSGDVGLAMSMSDEIKRALEPLKGMEN